MCTCTRTWTVAVQVRVITERWYEWQRKVSLHMQSRAILGFVGAVAVRAWQGRREYLDKTEKERAHVQVLFNQATKDAMQRFEELQADELWKEQNCRLCESD